MHAFVIDKSFDAAGGVEVRCQFFLILKGLLYYCADVLDF